MSSTQPRWPRALPWKTVSAVAVVAASVFAGLMLLSQRDCGWECSPASPWVEILLGLMAVVLVCLLALAVMFGLWLHDRMRRHGAPADAADYDSPADSSSAMLP
jgi:hypothetical protein